MPLTNVTELNNHLLTYLKARWSTPAMQNIAIPAGFIAWTNARNNPLDVATGNAFAAYAVLNPALNAPLLSAYTLANLPIEPETVQDYVVRYVHDRLQHQQLIDDAACQQMLNGITFVTAATAVPAMTAWYAPNSLPTFPAAVAAFKAHLQPANQYLTAQAVLALAAAAPFDYDAWAVQRITAVGAGGNDVALPKTNEGAACWNWALSACGPTPVPPTEVMDWLHSPLPAVGPDPSMPASIAAIVAPGPALNAKNALIGVKAALHGHRMAQLDPAYDPAWAADPARAGQVAALNRIVYTALVNLNGITAIAGPPSDFAVCVEYKIADGVSWEHWWIEYGPVATKTVVETFPRQKFMLNMTRQRQVDRMAPHQAAAYNVIRIEVTGLPLHQTAVRAALAQYL